MPETTSVPHGSTASPGPNRDRCNARWQPVTACHRLSDPSHAYRTDRRIIGPDRTLIGKAANRLTFPQLVKNRPTYVVPGVPDAGCR